MRLRGWLIVVTLILGAAGLLWFVYWLVTLPAGDPLSQADQRSSIINGATGVIALGFAVASYFLTLRLARTGDPRNALDSAATQLARRLRTQWEREAAYRQLRDPEPLNVLWEPVSRDVISKASQVIPGAGGDLDALTARFSHLDPQQLVIIGDPTSGKSSIALLLALTLLNDRETGERQRVPVFLSVSSWHPQQQSLADWLISRLAEEHPQLTRPEYGKHAPRDLVEQDRVLPILDGFDELSEELHDAARGRLVEAAVTGKPFVLTSRTASYRKTVRAQGKAFGQAAVVRLRPVTPEQAITFLTAGEIEEVQDRWEPVERQLKKTSSPLARVLSNPLMVYLARAAYSPRDTVPAQLTWFGSRKEIIQHLYDSYLPALYRSRYDPRRVARWLGLLARHQERTEQSADLAWWRLFLLVPQSRVYLALAVGTIANLLFFLQYGPPGLIAGFAAIALSRTLTDGRPPRQLRLRQIGPRKLLAAVAIGAAAGGALIPIVEPGYGSWFTVLGVSTIWITVTLLVGVAFGVRSPGTTDTVEPRAVLANDRTVLLGIITLVGVAVGIRSGVQYNAPRGLLDALQQTLLIGLLVSAGIRLGSGWLMFGLARLALRLRGGFPWRLLTFLEDAHRRGVLRRSGPFYQFRHADLQRYLADDHPTPPEQPSRPSG